MSVFGVSAGVCASAAVASSTKIGERVRFMASEATRSEEHTSELHSPCNLVCRLLLAKKKSSGRVEWIGYRRARGAWIAARGARIRDRSPGRRQLAFF